MKELFYDPYVLLISGAILTASMNVLFRKYLEPSLPPISVLIHNTKSFGKKFGVVFHQTLLRVFGYIVPISTIWSVYTAFSMDGLNSWYMTVLAILTIIGMVITLFYNFYLDFINSEDDDRFDS